MTYITVIQLPSALALSVISDSESRTRALPLRVLHLSHNYLAAYHRQITEATKKQSLCRYSAETGLSVSLSVCVLISL